MRAHRNEHAQVNANPTFLRSRRFVADCKPELNDVLTRRARRGHDTSPYVAHCAVKEIQCSAAASENLPGCSGFFYGTATAGDVSWMSIEIVSVEESTVGDFASA